jgi:hypothetical protein
MKTVVMESDNNDSGVTLKAGDVIRFWNGCYSYEAQIYSIVKEENECPLSFLDLPPGVPFDQENHPFVKIKEHTQNRLVDTNSTKLLTVGEYKLVYSKLPGPTPQDIRRQKGARFFATLGLDKFISQRPSDLEVEVGTEKPQKIGHDPENMDFIDVVVCGNKFNWVV